VVLVSPSGSHCLEISGSGERLRTRFAVRSSSVRDTQDETP
jgi:hypothetical protein